MRKKAANRIKAGLPDISEEQHERHTGIGNERIGDCNRSFMNSNKLSETAKRSDILQGANIFNGSDYFERCYCGSEVLDWCKNIICPHNSNPKQCLLDCQRTRAVNCNAGLDWSWKP